MTYQIIITFKILQFFTSCLTKLAKYFLLLWSANRRSQKIDCYACCETATDWVKNQITLVDT